MLLLELATQALRGFSPTSRSALRIGYNVLVPPAGVVPTVAQVLTSLFYTDARAKDSNLCTGQAVGRVAAAFQANDGATYRLGRSFGGATTLHRLEPASNTWTLVTQDAVEASARVRDLIRLPSRAQFEELFCTGAPSLPSRRSPSETKPTELLATGAGPTPSRGAAIRPTALVEAAIAASSRTKVDAAAARARAEELRAEIEAGRALDGEHFKLEGMHRRIYELEEKLKLVDQLITDVEVARRGCHGGHTPESLSLPPDWKERAARVDDGMRRRDEALQKVREDLVAAQQQMAGLMPKPLWKEGGFWAGLAAGAAALAAGIVFRGSTPGYLALLDVPAFGFAGFVALRSIGQFQALDERQHRVTVCQDREEKVIANFDADFLPIRAAMRVVGVDSGAELIDYLRAKETSRAALAGAEARLESARADPSLLSALDEQDALKAEAKALEAAIAEQSVTAIRDWREAERELRELEASLAEGATGEGPSAAATPAPAALPGKDDPTPRLLTLAQDLFGNPSLDALGAMVRDRAAQYLTALSDRRFQGLEIDARGQATLVSAGQKIAAGQLEDRDLDLLYLAVKLTLLEKQAPLRKLALVFDEPFVGFDEPKLQLLSRMLKHIAASTQVIHATALPAHMGLADSASKL